MVNVDTNSDAGSLAKALFCELRVAELRALASRDATQAAELLQRQQEATAFRAKLPPANRVPAAGDGLLSLDLGETGERLKKRVENAAAKLEEAEEEG
jgi:broad specificity phosphatase PhoE